MWYEYYKKLLNSGTCHACKPDVFKPLVSEEGDNKIIVYAHDMTNALKSLQIVRMTVIISKNP